MRRKERMIVEDEKILEILKDNKVCRLGMVDGNLPYVVPVNYGYSFDNGDLTIYIHGAKEGRKVDIIRRNNNVCIEIDCMHRLKSGDKPCNYSYAYRSLIGFGKAEFVEDREEKSIALNRIMENQMGKGDFCFAENMLAATMVMKIAIEGYSGKQND